MPRSLPLIVFACALMISLPTVPLAASEGRADGTLTTFSDGRARAEVHLEPRPSFNRSLSLALPWNATVQEAYMDIAPADRRVTHTSSYTALDLFSLQNENLTLSGNGLQLARGSWNFSQAGPDLGTDCTVQGGELDGGFRIAHSNPALSAAGGGVWAYRIPLTVQETGGLDRTNESVCAHIDFPAGSVSDPKRELRVTDQAGSEVTAFVWNASYTGRQCTGADLIFVVPALSALSSATFHVYFDNPKATPPSYGQQVLVAETFGSGGLPPGWTVSNLDGLTYSAGGRLRVQGTSTSEFWKGVSFEHSQALPGSFEVQAELNLSGASGTGYLALVSVFQDARTAVNFGIEYDAAVPLLDPAKYILGRTVSGSTTVDNVTSAHLPGAPRLFRGVYSSGTFTAYVDGNLLGAVDISLSDPRIRLSAATRAIGDSMDVSFDLVLASTGYSQVSFLDPVPAVQPGARETAGFGGSATLTSPLIENAKRLPYGTVWLEQGAGDDIRLDILGPDNGTLAGPLRSGEAVNLSPDDHPAVRLRAVLESPDPASTPRLSGWGIGDLWTAGLVSEYRAGSGSNLAAGADGLLLARSPERWTKSPSPALNLGVASTFDDAGVSHPCVLFVDGKYWMYYAGYDGARWRIGLATSPDGNLWTRHPDNPVLIAGTGWESSQVDWPYVVRDAVGFRMWYAGSADNGATFAIGYAWSDDGVTWTKHQGNPVLAGGGPGTWCAGGVFAPRLSEDGLSMWFAGRNSTATSIGHATSDDVIAWTPFPDNPVLGPQAGSWDSAGVLPGGVSRLSADGRDRMWYTGFNATVTGVGLAVSDGGTGWQRTGQNPLIVNGAGNAFDRSGAGFPAVVFRGLDSVPPEDPAAGNYSMYYSALNGTVWRIGSARAGHFPDGTIAPAGDVDLGVSPANLRMSASARAPPNTSVTVRVRTSPAPGTVPYSHWTNLTGTPASVPPGRYLQWTATLATGQNDSTPVLTGINAEFDYFRGRGQVDLPAVSLQTGEELASVLASPSSSGKTVTVLYSVDRGASWSPLVPDVPTNASGSSLLLRALLVGDHTTTPALGGLARSYTFRTFPLDCSLDVGADGRTDWAHLGIFTTGVRTGNLEAAMNAYLDAHRNDAGDSRLVPLSFSSATSCAVGVSSLQVGWTPVTYPNNPPRIDSQPPLRAIINELYIYIVDGRDPDRRDRLSYILDEAPGGMTLSGTTGELTWQPTADHIGYHNVSIVVSDGTASASQGYVLTVSTSPVNNPPHLSGSPAARATVGYEYSCSFCATDPDGDRVRFSLSSVSPAGAAIDEGTGRLVWIPAQNQAGFVTFRVLASDGVDTVWNGFSVNVSSEGANGLPAVTSVPPGTARAQLPYRHDLTATDPDGDAVTFGLVTGPPNATLSPGGRFEWVPAATETGTHGVVVRVSDNKGFSLFNFTIRVTGPNHPPIFLGKPDLLRVRAGSAWTFHARASDSDGDPLTYTLESKPGGMSIDPETGVLTWTPASSLSGRYLVSVVVSDGYARTHLNFTLFVEGTGAQQDFFGQYGFVIIVLLVLVVGGAAVASTMSRRRRPAGEAGGPPAVEPGPGEVDSAPATGGTAASGPGWVPPPGAAAEPTAARSDLPPPEPAASAEAEPMKPTGAGYREVQVAVVAPMDQPGATAPPGPATAAGAPSPAPAEGAGAPASGAPAPATLAQAAPQAGDFAVAVRLPPPAPTLSRPARPAAPPAGKPGEPELYKPIPGPYGEPAPAPDEPSPPAPTAMPAGAGAPAEGPAQAPPASGVSEDMDFISSFLKRRESGAGEGKGIDSTTEWGMLKDFKKELETTHTRPKAPSAPAPAPPPAPAEEQRPEPKKPEGSLSLDDILNELEK